MTSGEVIMPADLSGNVLSVNAEWTFVVLDIGADTGLKANAVMLVHRGNQLVGKIRVSEVRDSLAVAEILSDWVQVPMERGDSVISPRG